MESVYLETSVISYLVSRPSRDLQMAAHQQTTQDWWTDRRNKFECSVSQVVIDEASAGDPTEAAKRMTAIQGLPVLALVDETRVLTQAILATGVIPPRAARDAAHMAVAAVHEIDDLLTWNCKHLANAQIMRKMEQVCETLGWQLPVMCTPEELMED